MPKYRQLHTKTIDSFDFNEMPDDFTRVVWLLLPLILDSEGRGINNMAWVKSKMFPSRKDIVEDQIEKSFAWFANKNRRMIVRYTIKGHDYFYIPTWKTYQSGTQKEAPSVLPAPELLQSYSRVTPEEVGAAESASALLIDIESELPPSIFTFYNDAIGTTIPKMLADKLDLAEKEYKFEWIEYAFKECVSQNKRSWS
jgi:hypothetical protein